MGCYNACPRGDYDEPDGSNPAIAEGKTAPHAQMERLNAALAAPGKSRRSVGKG